MTLLELNQLPAPQAQAEFLKCCGATRWAQAMTAARPFDHPAHVFETAEHAWQDMKREDYLEAFSHHPRIGEKALREKFATTAGWAEQEQRGVQGASEATLRGLIAGNAAYDAKFGHVFLICATGKSAQEMLTALESRLKNDASTELRIAAAEQAQITRLRLERLLNS